MILNVFCVVGLIGYVVAMGGLWNHLWMQAKVKSTVGVVLSVIFLVGMMVAFGFAIIGMMTNV